MSIQASSKLYSVSVASLITTGLSFSWVSLLKLTSFNTFWTLAWHQSCVIVRCTQLKVKLAFLLTVWTILPKDDAHRTSRILKHCLLEFVCLYLLSHFICKHAWTILTVGTLMNEGIRTDDAVHKQFLLPFWTTGISLRWGKLKFLGRKGFSFLTF